MEDIEIQAEVFRVVRANMDRPLKTIEKMLREQLPGIEKSRITKALGDLIYKDCH